MRSWLERNAIWLGSLGAIAGIIALVVSFLPKEESASQAQTAVVSGNSSKVVQTQNEPSDSQSQNAVVEGDGSSVFQKQ